MRTIERDEKTGTYLVDPFDGGLAWRLTREQLEELTVACLTAVNRFGRNK